MQAKCNVNVDIKPIKVTDIKIRQKSYTIISLNQTPSFRTTITPSNATNKEVKWTSSNENIAVVSENGIVTPVKMVHVK